MARRPLFRIDANNTSNINPLNTDMMFDQAFSEVEQAPIDTYFQKTTSLIILINPTAFSSLMANLVVLGYISVFESYMREIIRKTVLIDSFSRNLCESMNLSYGAAISHEPKLLPEAILEDISFAGKENIKSSIIQFTGIKGHLPNSFSLALDEFDKVCQVRHCLVHRFGKLGTKNAIKLGLNNHKACIEKPLKLDYLSLQEIQHTCNVVVKEINNYLFNGLMKRLIVDVNQNDKKITNTVWKWNFNSDRSLFSKYYKTFVSTFERTTVHSNIKEAYNIYRDFYRSIR